MTPPTRPAPPATGAVSPGAPGPGAASGERTDAETSPSRPAPAVRTEAARAPVASAGGGGETAPGSSAAVAGALGAAGALADLGDSFPPTDPADAPDVSALGARGEGPAAPAKAEAPLPARLAAPVWVRALDKATGTRAIRVALDDGGSVELRKTTEADGVAVRIRFSDPDLQQLAGAHAARLRETLADHFAEPVRLDLGDATPDGGSGERGERARSAPGRRGGLSDTAPVPDPSPTRVRPAPSAGRHEWIG